MFKLDSHLQNDTVRLGSFALSDVLLMNDARYPWVILVPRREDVTEVYELANTEQQQLWQESSFVAEKLSAFVNADKMNVAAIGNVVSQLHIHHVARFRSDEVWPAPVWGRGTAIPYSPIELEKWSNDLKQLFAEQWQDGK